ncbi:MAG: protein of unknown function with transrane region [Parcubacteria group bacterium]|nr:protein of unknown function with transrane region [Parcubacteria group bacterium]
MNNAVKILLGALALVLLVVVWKSASVRDSLNIGIDETSTTTSATSTPSINIGLNQNGQISGHITLSPVCPVERMPPDPLCAPKGFETTVVIRFSEGREVARIKTDTQGEYSAWVPGGRDYDVSPEGGAVYPRCETKTVSVKAGANTIANISCDTGIR